MTKAKAYFFFLTLYLTAIYLYLFAKNLLSVGFLSFFDALFLFGVYGYAFKRRILSHNLWQILSAVSAIVYTYSAARALHGLRSVGWLELSTAMAIIAPYIPLAGIPFFLFRYGQKSNGIW